MEKASHCEERARLEGKTEEETGYKLHHLRGPVASLHLLLNRHM